MGEKSHKWAISVKYDMRTSYYGKRQGSVCFLKIIAMI